MPDIAEEQEALDEWLIARLDRAHIMGASRPDSVSTYSEARDGLAKASEIE